MVSYNNFLPYPQKPNPANIPYPASQPWQWTANYHTPPNHQYIGEMDTPHAAHHQMYYNPHPMFHSATNAAAAAASDWHSPSSAESFAQNAQIYQHQLINGSAFASGTIISSTPSSSSTSSSSTTSAGPASGGTHLNESVTSVIGEQQQHQHQIQQQQQQQQQQQPLHLTEGLPSPPITVSGSEISSPGAPASSFSPHHIAAHNLGTNNHSPKSNNNNNHNSNSTPKHKNNRASPIRAHPYFEWMKKSSHPAQPAPGNYTEAELGTTPNLDEFSETLDTSGKTRTKDKYRVVYTDFQRLELEKEYCTTRYITIRRKTELALMLTLSERQVKIWFQNRRAKERKQHKKVNEPSLSGVQPKLEPGLQLQHSLHPMNPMAMGMPTMRLHPHLHAHSLAVSAAQSHQLPHPQISAAAAAVANNMPSLPM